MSTHEELLQAIARKRERQELQVLQARRNADTPDWANDEFALWLAQGSFSIGATRIA